MEQVINLNKRTKVIATLGPNSNEATILKTMLIAGVNVIRLNASHQSDPESVKKAVQLIRRTSKKVGKEVGIFLDLQGPKFRIGNFKEDRIEILEGAEFKLTTENVLGDQEMVSVNPKEIVKGVKKGELIYIHDGKIRLLVKDVQSKTVTCVVEKGGVLTHRKGINLPTTLLSVSALTKKDRKDAHLAVDNKLDYIALSFVSYKQDIVDFRKYLDSIGGKKIKIIAKIEKQVAVDNVCEIIDTADSVMVARGDLGVEIGFENVPRVQKQIIYECNKRVRPVIVATQMLDSMVKAPVATRAEVSDVANAIYDNCDSVMLSDETAIGIDPSNVIKMINRICVATDIDMIQVKKRAPAKKDIFNVKTTATSFCKAADQIAEENEARAIMTFTSSGNTPLIASKLNSIFPIIACTDNQLICRQLTLCRGVIPVLLPKKFKDIYRWTDMINMGIREAKSLKLLEKDDRIVVTAGRPIGVSNGINSIRLVVV